MRCLICDYSDNKEEQSLFHLGIHDETHGRRNFVSVDSGFICSVCDESNESWYDIEEEKEGDEDDEGIVSHLLDTNSSYLATGGKEIL